MYHHSCLTTILAILVVTFRVEARNVQPGPLAISLETGALRSSSKKGLNAVTSSGTASGEKKASGENKEDDDSPFGGLIGGCLLWMLIPICLWQNERIAVNQYKMQMKAERWAITIEDTKKEPLADMNGHMIFMTGDSSCSQELEDDKFPKVKAKNTIKLRRVVQMYQYVETSSEEGPKDNRRTVYHHNKDWRDTHQTCPHAPKDPSEDYINPAFPFPSTTRTESKYRAFQAIGSGNGVKCAEAEEGKVRIGAYYLGEWVIRELTKWQGKDDVTEAMLDTSKPDRGTEGCVKGPVNKASDGWFYFNGKTAGSPGKGDVRVRFEELQCGPITVCGVLTKDKTGWTVVPVIRADSISGEACMAEFGKSCCSCLFRVKELHYGEDAEEDKEFAEILKERPVELERSEKRMFAEADYAYEKEKKYKPEKDDGPMTLMVTKAMEWFGLEEEFLAVAEEERRKSQLFKQEAKAAETRHHIARILGFFGLLLATDMIISPIINLLNINWLTSLLGGAILSAFICITSCLFTVMAFCCIVGVAWIRYRPLLGMFSLSCVACAGVGMYMYINAESSNNSAAAALLAWSPL